MTDLRGLAAAAAEALGETLSVAFACEARLRTSREDPRRALASRRMLCLFHLDAVGVSALLELELRFAAGLVAHLAGAPLPATPVLGLTAFERAALEYLALVALAALRTRAEAEGRWRPRLVGVAPSRQDAADALGRGPLLAVELGLRAGNASTRGALLLPASALGRVAAGVPEDAPRAGGAARAARLSFRPTIRCGVLWPQELRELGPGAALVLPDLRCVDGQCHGALQLRRAGMALEGQLAAPGWTLVRIDSSPDRTEVTCVDPQLSTLPVELEVELASVPLTFGELAALAPGTVVPLRISVGDPVFLRAGDRRIARAELVDLEGEVAARVLELVE